MLKALAYDVTAIRTASSAGAVMGLIYVDLKIYGIVLYIFELVNNKRQY